MDIVNTVLDGEFEGTIMSVDMDHDSRIELNGLTLVRGEGHDDASGVTAGAVDFVQAGIVEIKNMVFHNNRTLGTCAAVYYSNIDWPVCNARFYFHNINSYNNERYNLATDPRNAIEITYAKSIIMSKLRISTDEITYSKQYKFIAADTLLAEDCCFSGLNDILSAPVDFGSTNVYDDHSYIELKDIYVTDNTFTRSGGFYVETDIGGYGSYSNIHLERNHFPNGGMQFEFRGQGHFRADSIFICNNVSEKSYAIFNSNLPGTIRNLFVVANHMGSNEIFVPTWPGVEARVNDVSIDNAEYAENIVEKGPTEGGDYSSGGSLLYISCNLADTLIYKNIRFINNQYIDHDNYSLDEMSQHDIADISANFGRMIRGVMGNHQPIYIMLDSCTFFENHIDNIIPEINSQILAYRLIGSNLDIVLDNDDEGAEMKVQNIDMYDCDDGGINLVNNNGNMIITNVCILNTKRNGLTMTLGNSMNRQTLVNNVLINGIQQQESYTTYPFFNCFQSALSVSNYSASPIVFSNITIVNNDVPLLIRNFGGDLQNIVSNSIIMNNSYNSFMYPLGDELLFSYCLLSENIPGQGNIWDLDPEFDSELGPPWLALDSPCVDAGDPSPHYNDLEDPSNPGFAFWPSHGALRNDMGCTGGPHAALVDTSWMSVPAWEPRIRPNKFFLKFPWPNPFNSSASIEFTLNNPGLARLTVHNLLGQEVAVLNDGVLPSGTFYRRWDAQGQASGLYFITLQVDLDRTETRAVTLLR